MLSSTKRVLRLFALGCLATLLTLAAMLLVPHSRYIQWQDMRIEAYARLGWIYERIHDDKTPIDVAFIGTSHTMNGIDDAAVQQELDRLTGQDLHVVNLSVPSYGRNLQWVVARELLNNRAVKTLVIEVFENESRKSHPLFIYAADPRDVLHAPALINLRYFQDMALLPLHQLRLGVETLLPEAFGLKRQFSTAQYDGSNVDNTRIVHVHGENFTPLRDRRLTKAALDAEAKTIAGEKDLHMLGERFAWLEYRYPLHYLNAMIDLAKAKGVTVKFLYLPSYGQPPKPFDMRPYDGKGEMLFANDVLADPGHWNDFHHLNMFGAAALSARVASLLAGTRTP